MSERPFREIAELFYRNYPNIENYEQAIQAATDASHDHFCDCKAKSAFVYRGHIQIVSEQVATRMSKLLKESKRV